MDNIPERPKLIRQVYKEDSDTLPEQPSPKPLVWSSQINPEYVWQHPTADAPEEIVPCIPERIRPNSFYPVLHHISLPELVQSLHNSFDSIGLLWFRQGNKYRWDVRTHDTFLGIGIDVQIFKNDEQLCVYFQKHYGEDNWRADILIDKIASNTPVNMTNSINPWKTSVLEIV